MDGCKNGGGKRPSEGGEGGRTIEDKEICFDVFGSHRGEGTDKNNGKI